jgi:hypothetical protein
MPPSLAHDAEIKALRMHLKKKRSQMAIASHSRLAKDFSQRTLQGRGVDPDSSSEETSTDDELEQLFIKKQSLTLDERIARKKEKERYQCGTSLILTKSCDEDTKKVVNRNAKTSSSDVPVEELFPSDTVDVSSDSEDDAPDTESVDSMPLSYTPDQASLVVKAYDKKLASAGRFSSKGSVEKQMLQRKMSYEERIHQKIAKEAATSERSRKKAAVPGVRRRSMSADGKLELTKNVPTAANDEVSKSTDRRLQRLHLKHLSMEERIEMKLAEEKNKTNSIYRRRSISAPRPGVEYLQHAPTPSKSKEGTKATTDSAQAAAVQRFEERLKRKLSQGSTKSLPTRSLPKRSLPAKSQSNREWSSHNATSETSRNNGSVDVRSSAKWECKKCTFLNNVQAISNVSDMKCTMCLEPRRQLSKVASKSERTLNCSASRQKLRSDRKKVSMSLNAGAAVGRSGDENITWNDLGAIINETISMSLIDAKGSSR